MVDSASIKEECMWLSVNGLKTNFEKLVCRMAKMEVRLRRKVQELSDHFVNILDGKAKYHSRVLLDNLHVVPHPLYPFHESVRRLLFVLVVGTCLPS